MTRTYTIRKGNRYDANGAVVCAEHVRDLAFTLVGSNGSRQGDAVYVIDADVVLRPSPA